MKKIEYLIQHRDNERQWRELGNLYFAEDISLRELGEKGWELCGIYHADVPYFIFKREIK